jgi:hypothetical protein
MCIYILYIYIMNYIYIYNWELGMSEGQHKEFTKYVSSVKHVLGRDVIYTCMNSAAVLSFC